LWPRPDAGSDFPNKRRDKAGRPVQFFPMTTRFLSAVFFLAAAGVPLARAWDPVGHMLTMSIALGDLTPKARTELEATISRFNEREKPDAPYDPVTIPCWMDDVRARTREFNEWHYVNLPFTRDGLPAPEGSRFAPDVIWGVKRCGEIIRAGAIEPGIDRDQAVVMLLHLFGDIHQPLHTTNRNDAGGNRVAISNLEDEQSDLLFTKGGNLHFFWDTSYRRAFKGGKAGVSYSPPLYERERPVAGHMAARALVDQQAAILRKTHPRASFENRNVLDPAAIAGESHTLGFDLAYGKLPAAGDAAAHALDEPYTAESRMCGERRIVLAGYRLADLLNGLLDPPAARRP
jgi:hypothetical protein